MAKKPKQPKWKPSQLDAINLSTLRWYAMEIEQLSIQLYASDNNKVLFPATLKLLAKVTADLRTLGGSEHAVDHPCQKKVLNAIGRCGGSYVLCDDGLCYPPGECS